jgi:rhamnulokinase
LTIRDATNRTVVAGPSEATAAGNVLVQAMGAGALSGLKEARQMVKRSFKVNVIEPRSTEGWGAACEKFHGLPL